MKKIIVNYRSAHHSNHSGYDRILDYLDNAIKIPSNKSKRVMSYRLAKFISSFVDKTKGEYDSNSVVKEI